MASTLREGLLFADPAIMLRPTDRLKTDFMRKIMLASVVLTAACSHKSAPRRRRRPRLLS